MAVDLEHVPLPTADGRHIDAIIARPADPGPWPGIVVVHELFGIDDEMVKQASHLAGLGYLALMPMPFS